MPLGEVLYTSGGELPYVYFPTTCIVSLVYVMANGSSAEIAVTGYEGLLGVSLLLGGQTTPNQAVVQSAGHAYRIRADVIKHEFEQGGPLQHLLLLYTQALIAQMAQTAVCNRHHSLDQQLCRWLLLSLDRLRSGDLTMTQELIANMLGVRRQGVAEAAGNLQKAGLINYHRGHISVLDRPGLERRVCECYAVVKHEYDRLLPG
jgi:CRP-like cAMP-binding protein